MRRVESVQASQVLRKAVAWALAGRVAYGYLTLLIGEQGLGKSQWLTWLAAENSRAGAVTLVCSAEDGWDTTIRPRLEAWQANLDLVRFVEIALTDGSADGLLLPDDADELSREIHDTGAKIVTIDPVLAHLGRSIDSHKDASVRQALAPLARLAGEHNVAVVGSHHLNKSVGTDPLSRASASVAFTAQARSVLLWARDPDDEDGERGSRRCLASVKSNLAPLAPTQAWTIEPILLQADSIHPEVATSRVTLVGESEHTGRDLLVIRDDEQRSAVEEAAAFLVDELRGGAVPAKMVLADARSLGISEITLRRAAQRLSVTKTKSGSAPAGTGASDTPSKMINPHEARAIITFAGTAQPCPFPSLPIPKVFIDKKRASSETSQRWKRTNSTGAEPGHRQRHENAANGGAQVSSYTDDQIEFVHKLEELADLIGKPADDDSRALIAEIQDEFDNMKRAAVREGYAHDDRLTIGDVLDFGAEVDKDFPKAQKGCEVFASVYFIEKIENAPNN